MMACAAKRDYTGGSPPPRIKLFSRPMVMKKPSIFNLWDFITFGGPSLAVTAIAAYVQFATKQDTQAYALMWTCAAGFWFVYAMLVRARWQWLKNVAFMTSHGLCVIFKDGFTFSSADIEKSTSEMITAWQAVIDNLKGNYSVPKAFEPNFFGDFTFVTFKQGPLEHAPFYKIKLNGYTIGRSCVIGVPAHTTDLPHTAFQHELGHVVYSMWTKNWSGTANDEEHAFIKAHGLR